MFDSEITAQALQNYLLILFTHAGPKSSLGLLLQLRLDRVGAFLDFPALRRRRYVDAQDEPDLKEVVPAAAPMISESVLYDPFEVDKAEISDTAQIRLLTLLPSQVMRLRRSGLIEAQTVVRGAAEPDLKEVTPVLLHSATLKQQIEKALSYEHNHCNKVDGVTNSIRMQLQGLLAPQANLAQERGGYNTSFTSPKGGVRDPGAVLQKMGDLDSAEAAYQEALRRSELKFGSESLLTLELALVLAGFRIDRHKRQQPKQNVVWCAAGSETYVNFNFTTALDSVATDAIVVNGTALLNYTYSQILAQIKANGDGIISTSGSYPISYESNGQLVASGQVNSNGVPYTFSLVGAAPGNSTITASDANGHQTTLGVFGAAVGALQNYMSGQGYGTAIFDIYDGKNQVGTGTFAP